MICTHSVDLDPVLAESTSQKETNRLILNRKS